MVRRTMRADARPPSADAKRAERIGTRRDAIPPLCGSVCVSFSVAATSPRGSMGNTRARNIRSPTSSSSPGSR